MKKISNLLIYITIFLALLVFISCSQNSSNQIADGYRIEPVKQENIQMKESLLKDRIQTVQDTTIEYGFQKCEQKGRLDNFLIAGGKKEGPIKGKMPFDDSDVYKVLEGASYSLMNEYDTSLASYLDSVISIIEIGQESDGYLTTWKTVDPQNPPAEWCPPGGRWENLSFSHELYNAGHLYHAAAAHYQATGKTNLLSIATQNADLICKVFGEDKNEIPPGHQIIESGLIRLYKITEKEKYLDLAMNFLEWRGDSTTHELYGPYSQDHKSVIVQDEAVGHAVRAVYMYEAMTDIAVLKNNQKYWEATKDLWQNIVSKKLYLTGGIGAKHEGESFGKNYELPNLSAYAETCAAIGLVMWNYKMFQATGKGKYFDIIERSLYNGLLSGLSLEGTKFFYPNPLEADSSYKFNKGSITRKPWFDCSCCPTNLMRFIPSIPKYVYSKNNDVIFANLFTSNKSKFQINNNSVVINQKTNYPWDKNVNFSLTPEKPTQFTLKIRLPGWVRNQPVPSDLYRYQTKSDKSVQVTINGEEAEYSVNKGYITLGRKWEKGDQIKVKFPMPIRQVQAHKKVKADSGKLALEKGPVVYCAEEVDNKTSVFNYRIPDDLQLTSQYKAELLQGVRSIKGQLPVQDSLQTVTGQTQYQFRAVPYYVWSNRTPGSMRIWFPESPK